MSDPTISAHARTVNQNQSNEVVPAVEVRAGDLLPCPSDKATGDVSAHVGAHPTGSVAQRLEQGTHNPQRARRPGKTGRKTGDKSGADGADAADVRDQGWRTLAHSGRPETPKVLEGFAGVHHIPVPSSDTGVYVLFYDRRPVYVGQALCICQRISDHACEGRKLFDSAWYIRLARSQLCPVESALITLLAPRYNRRKDGRLHGSCFESEAVANLSHHISPAAIQQLRSYRADVTRWEKGHTLPSPPPARQQKAAL